MIMAKSPSDEARRSRNIFYVAFIILIIIYFVKFTFPHHTVVSTYQAYVSTHYPSAKDSASLSSKGIVNGVPQPNQIAKTQNAASDNGAKSVNTHMGEGSLMTTTDASNITISTKVAVIMETRPRDNLIPLILHFSSVLGPSWPIIIYTESEMVGKFSASAALARHIRSGLVQIRILPSTVLFTNSDSVNSFFTKPWFWQSLAPAKHILIFQSDSMLCANAARSVEDFFEYDFIGAPIAQHLGRGFNGGLSLRKRETMLRVIDEYDWETDKGSRFEDRWFFDKISEMMQLQMDENGDPPTDGSAILLPSVEVARTFSVETIDYPHPLGVHQVHRWLEEQMLSLDVWCPEWKLCSTEYIRDT